jgi:hypothetical protein
MLKRIIEGAWWSRDMCVCVCVCVCIIATNSFCLPASLSVLAFPTSSTSTKKCQLVYVITNPVVTSVIIHDTSLFDFTCFLVMPFVLSYVWHLRLSAKYDYPKLSLCCLHVLLPLFQSIICTACHPLYVKNYGRSLRKKVD